jgi:hypothetical protein
VTPGRKGIGHAAVIALPLLVWLSHGPKSSAILDARGGQNPVAEPRRLRIVVIEGENAVNIIQQKTAVAPVVEVRDRNDQPVAGVLVTFAVRGGRASFGGARTLTVTTNAAGRAAASGFVPSAVGAVQIVASATVQGETAAATITQTNYATAAAAQSAASGAGASAGGGGFPGTAIGIAAGAAGAGALVIVKARGGSAGSNTPVPGSPPPAGSGGSTSGGGSTGGTDAPAVGGTPSCSRYRGNIDVAGTNAGSVCNALGTCYTCTYVQKQTFQDVVVDLAAATPSMSDSRLSGTLTLQSGPCNPGNDGPYYTAESAPNLALTPNGDGFAGMSSPPFRAPSGLPTTVNFTELAVAGRVAGGTFQGTYRYRLEGTVTDPVLQSYYPFRVELNGTFDLPPSCP